MVDTDPDPDTVVQDHRFDIVEDIGCQPEIPAVFAGTIFFWLPALVLTLLSFFSCCEFSRRHRKISINIEEV